MNRLLDAAATPDEEGRARRGEPVLRAGDAVLARRRLDFRVATCRAEYGAVYAAPPVEPDGETTLHGARWQIGDLEIRVDGRELHGPSASVALRDVVGVAFVQRFVQAWRQELRIGSQGGAHYVTVYQTTLEVATRQGHVVLGMHERSSTCTEEVTRAVAGRFAYVVQQIERAAARAREAEPEAVAEPGEAAVPDELRGMLEAQAARRQQGE